MEFDLDTTYTNEENYKTILKSSLGSMIATSDSAYITAETEVVAKVLGYLHDVSNLGKTEQNPVEAIYTLDNWANRLGTFRYLNETDEELRSRIEKIYRLPLAGSKPYIAYQVRELTGSEFVSITFQTDTDNDETTWALGTWSSDRCIVDVVLNTNKYVYDTQNLLDRICPAWMTYTVSSIELEYFQVSISGLGMAILA